MTFIIQHKAEIAAIALFAMIAIVAGYNILKRQYDPQHYEEDFWD